MFRWLKRLFGGDPVIPTINIHITGEVKVKHEGGPGYTVVSAPGSVDTNATPKTSVSLDRGPQPAEPDITPELFADTRTPEVSFGVDAEEPPKRTPDQNN